MVTQVRIFKTVLDRSMPAKHPGGNCLLKLKSQIFSTFANFICFMPSKHLLETQFVSPALKSNILYSKNYIEFQALGQAVVIEARAHRSK